MRCINLLSSHVYLMEVQLLVETRLVRSLVIVLAKRWVINAIHQKTVFTFLHFLIIDYNFTHRLTKSK